MEVLYFVEKIRTPFLDFFFSTVNHLGEETFFIILGIIFFWCVNKKEGYYLLTVGFLGTILSQFLKLFFRVPRPWVKDKNFTIVESARAEATGYSFPSGHTQSAVGIFGGIARWNAQKWLRITGIVVCVLVSFSRLYLGVHTPLDVGVGAVISIVLIFVFYPLIHKCFKKKNCMRILFLSIIGMCVAHLCFASFYNFPKDAQTENIIHGIENAYKMLGCTIGVYIVFEIDSRYTNFETDGNFLCQLLKLLLGAIPLIAIKSGLKEPLLTLFDGSYVANSVRYLILVIFVGCVWPLTFKWFKKITTKR